MKVIRCTLKDISRLCELTQEFAEETKWPFTFDYDVCTGSFFDHITSPISVTYAVEVDGELAAAAILIAHQDFCLEKQGFLHKFYVRNKYRSRKCAFLLMPEICKWFDEQGCVESFATSTSGISEEVICAFAKLMRKYGFKDCGPTLARSIYG